MEIKTADGRVITLPVDPQGDLHSERPLFDAKEHTAGSILNALQAGRPYKSLLKPIDPPIGKKG